MIRFAVAYLSLGDCLATTNRYTEAEAVLNKCLTLDGSKVKDIRSHVTAKKSCVLRLGKMFAAIGKHQKTVQLFTSTIKSEGSSSRVNISLIICRMNDYNLFIISNNVHALKIHFDPCVQNTNTYCNILISKYLFLINIMDS